MRLVPLSLAIVLTSPSLAMAAAGGGGGLAWEAPLVTLRNSFTGPVAYTIAILAVFAILVSIVFANEIGPFVSRMILGVAASAVLVGVVAFFGAIGIAGAVV